MKMVRGLMEDPRWVWLQIDMSGGRSATCDVPVVIDNRYVAASELGEVGGSVGNAV